MIDWLLEEEVLYLIPPMALLLVLCLVLVIRQHRQRQAGAIRLQSRSNAGGDPRQRLVGIALNAIMLFSGLAIGLYAFNLVFLSYPRPNEHSDMGNLISNSVLFVACIGLHWLNRARSRLVRYVLVLLMTAYVLVSTSPDYLFEQRGVITLAIPLVVAGALLSFEEMLLYLVVTLLVYAFLPAALLENYTGDYFVIMMLFAVGTAASVTSSTLTRAINRESALRKVQERMLRTVSHEMRTPVVTLQGFWKALRLKREEIDLGPLAPLTDSIEEQTAYLHQLIERVMWFTSAQRDTLPFEQVDLAEIVKTTALQMAPVAAESGMTLVTVGTDGPVYVEATSELQTLLVNLVDNAIKHSGGSQVEVRVERDANDIASLTVRDDGRGIASPEIMAQPWVHQDTTVHGDLSRGYGLGLAIVQDICRRNGAKIVAKNEQHGLKITVLFSSKRDRAARRRPPWAGTTDRLRRR